MRPIASRLRVAFIVCAIGLTLPAVALAAFPGSDPDESPRLNTPNDPAFDRCETDDPDTPALDCRTYFEEEYGLFGFRPDTATTTPLLITPTQYLDCSQLDAQGRAANIAAGDPECSQLGGVRADTAWKRTTGDPDTVIAILDTGIRWQDRELVEQIHLNAAELPEPLADRSEPLGGGPACATFVAADDANGDGAFNVRDFACDSGVAVADGDTESDDILDGSDLIATFSNSSDEDSNGYKDDIAGWDFFDDDNDPFDASSCCNAVGHGSGRAREAAAATNNANGGPGICPDCQIMPLRIWDTFVTPTDFHSMGLIYAADNGASVVEGANGGLTNTRFSRRAYEYADAKGLALMLVSSDVNSANHNYPTNYNEAVYVGGALPDTAPFDTCEGIGGLPGIGDLASPPEEFSAGCDEMLGLLEEFAGILPTPIVGALQPPTTSFFRNANLTQYGGKADIVLMGSTGSENTGQAAGAAGLLASYGREILDSPLSGNEIRQLLTMTAEDVLPANTGTIGPADKANPGWDPHFGYGRVNLAAATKRIQDERIPPEAQINSPDWFAPINVDRLGPDGLAVTGRIAAPHSDSGVGAWELDYACGADALDTAFLPVPDAGGGVIAGSGPVDGSLGTIPTSLLTDLAANCDGSVADDFGRPSGGIADGNLPGDAYPEPDPERHSFQIRLTVHEAGDEANIGRYRKALFAYEDDGNLPAWPRPMGAGSDPEKMVTETGGEVSPRLYDLDGDNKLDVIQTTSSGEIYVLDADGDPLPSWNQGDPVLTESLAVAAAHGTPAAVGGPPLETPRVPVIGDINGDEEADIVTTAGERVYAWDRKGQTLDGFPVRIDPALSEPCAAGVEKPCFDVGDRVITTQNHIKRGISGSPALADLDGDGMLDVVTGSFDQHVYAWDGAGDPLPGWPVKVASEGAPGAEIITSPSIAQLDGDGPPEVVIATNEVVPGDPEFPTNIFELTSSFLGSSTGANPVYALHGDGTEVGGWPVMVGVADGDLLPLVLPGHDAAVYDRDGDGQDEVVVSAGTSLGNGGTRVVDGSGTTELSFNSLSGNSADPGPVINVADYASIGALAGDSPSVVKGGISLNGAANLLAPNQNLPFAHVVQAWDASDAASGAGLPGYPRATDDFQLISQPAVANVGPGSERQFLYGTGLYQLHAYGTGGVEPAGWPKFLGGWVQATPSVGDVDGDGDLEVSALSREGWSFLWDTHTPACEAGGQTTNDEWWTFHHDERGSGNYGGDGRPPATPGQVDATLDEQTGEVNLTWSEPGDDWHCGSATAFRILLSDGPIEGPRDATDKLAEASAIGANGDEAGATLTALQRGDATHAGVVYRDEVGNWGLASSIRLPQADVPDRDDDGVPDDEDECPDEAGPEANGGCPEDPGPDPEGKCANVIRGTDGRDRLRGTDGTDKIIGRGGRDRITDGAGADCLRGGRGRDRIIVGKGRDRINGGPGNDVIKTRKGARDAVRCGRGRHDLAIVGPRDSTRGCERVRRGGRRR